MSDSGSGCTTEIGFGAEYQTTPMGTIPAESAVQTSTDTLPTKANSSIANPGMYPSAIRNAGTALGFKGHLDVRYVRRRTDY